MRVSAAGREHFLLGRSEAFQRKGGRTLSLGRTLKNGERDLTQGLELELQQGITNGTSLVAHWLRICLAMLGMWVQPLVGELRSYILQGSYTHELQLLSLFTTTKILHATPKTQCSQINK